MALVSGSRVGPYEVTAPLGAGGMGEVYRARDTKLKRDVAVKVLPESLAADVDRLARFQREAEVLATLNHPNIAQIYGLEEADGVNALVMELIEGPTLAERLAQVTSQKSQGTTRQAASGGLSLDEAMSIAKQIAEALEAAHERGITHRDLKPANIKLRPDGVVKVLDFGLAKLNAPNGPNDPNASQSPTITTPAMTGVGVILGTAAYMSPEQACGKPVDKRADIWAFGCVLYEMLNGRRAFEGDDVAVTLARVVEREPDLDALPPSVPARVRQVLRVCLRKDPKQRVADIRDVRLALEGAFETAHVQAVASTAAAQPAGWRRVAALAAALIAGGAIAGAVVWFAARPPQTAGRVSRLTMVTPPTAALSINGADHDVAITPDGSRVIYVGNGGTQLFVRSLDTIGPAPVVLARGTPRGPFVSPDGQWVAYLEGNGRVRKVAITGGPPVTLFDEPVGAPRGATWTADDTVIFATADPTIGLYRVPAAGGTPTVLTRPDGARGEADHVWPEALPGGDRVLFTIIPRAGGLDAAQIAVLDLRTGTSRVLVRGGSHARYVAGGYLVYAVGGTLHAVPFDPTTSTVLGPAVPIGPQVVTAGTGAVDAAVANDGTLVYVPGDAGAGQRVAVWVDRQGRETPIAAPPHLYQYPRLSPDGRRMVLVRPDEGYDLWLWDLERTTLTRMTLDPAQDSFPVWTPDSQRLIFTSARAGLQNLYWLAVDGTGSVERLTESKSSQNTSSISPDGTRVLFSETAPATGYDVMMLRMDGTRRVEPLIQTPFDERNAEISPDGRWVAYQSDESGQLEVYVRPFPTVSEARWQVSTGGGTRPLWARNSLELFYLASDGGFTRVGVQRGATWTAAAPERLLDGIMYAAGGFSSRPYDISPDGLRFLMTRAGDASGPGSAAASLIVVQNWTEELKRLVPAR